MHFKPKWLLGILRYEEKPKNSLLYCTPRTNVRCKAWPMARTPRGVLIFESSLPPLAHFLRAENMAEGNEQPALWCGHFSGCRSRSSDKCWIFLTQTMLKGDIVKWHSWKRWWIAQLLSQDMAFCKEWRKTSRGSRGPGAGKKIGKIFCPFFAFFFLPQTRAWSHVKLSWPHRGR